MSSYKATVIKTGNSYALRVPKAYADSLNLKLGEKVLLSPARKIVKQDRAKIQRLFKELQEIGAFQDVKDPVAWQKEMREERPLPDRQ